MDNYPQHCDGPWSVYPFCHVYRVMLAVNENVQVETIFTMQKSGGCLSDGDAAGFDYNREIHVISGALYYRTGPHTAASAW